MDKTDRNDARGIAQMIRVGLYRPVHVKTLRSQKLRMLLTHRKLLQFLAAERLHMHRTVQSHPDHLSDAARVIAVGLVDLRLQHRLHVPRLDTDHR